MEREGCWDTVRISFTEDAAPVTDWLAHEIERWVLQKWEEHVNVKIVTKSKTKSSHEAVGKE